MAKAFRPGDWRSGYYRDQTLLMALGLLTLEQFFAQLYAHADEEAEPASAGRQMNCHFGMRLVNPDGSWRVQTTQVNIASDISPTGSQMPRLVGLAYASRLYRELPELRHMTAFSNNGEEIAWGTIGNATCAEGMFWEAVNAIGVLRAPAIISIWTTATVSPCPTSTRSPRATSRHCWRASGGLPGGRDGFDSTSCADGIIRRW
jgi:TPP-dependent pyruvate/acetoin dehydrogenase alpha subunit